MFECFDEIALVNVQSHKMNIFKFKGKTIHRIRGSAYSNSEGKSVLRKALEALMTPKGKTKEERLALIRKEPGVNFCRIIATSTDGLYFELYLHKEEKYCHYIMKQDDFEVKKYFSDDYQVLLNLAGFHFMADEGYSMNIYKTKEAMPFTHFRPRLNYKILDSAKGLRGFDTIMFDVERNISLIEEEMTLLNNMTRVNENHLNSMGDLDLEAHVRKETLIEQFIGFIEPLELSLPRVKDTLIMIEELNSKDALDFSAIRELKPNIDYIRSSSSSLADTISIRETLDTIPKDEITPSIKPLVEEISYTENLLRAVRSLASFKCELLNTNVNNISEELSPVIKEMSSIKHTSVILSSLIDFISEYQSHISDTTDLASIEWITSELTSMRLLASDIKRLISYSSELNLISDKKDSGRALVDLFDNTDTVRLLSETISSLADTITLKGALSECESVSIKLKSELTDLEKSLEKCPECGQPLNHKMKGDACIS